MRFLKRIHLSPGVSEALRNISWLGSDRIVRMAGAVLVGIVVARYLGPNQFGELNYALALYGLFNTLSNLGLDYLVVRDVALNPENEEAILGTSFLLKVLASFVTTLSAIVCAWLLRPHDSTSIIIVTLLSVASIAQGFDVVDYFFQAKVRSRFAVVPKTAVFLMASLSRVIAVLMKASLITFAWIAAIEIFLSEVGLAIAYFHYHKKIRRWNFDTKQAASLLKESWPLMLSGLLIIVYMRTDQILLGTLSTSAVVGEYSAAVRLSEIWYAIPMIICASVMPRLLKFSISDPVVYRDKLQKLYDMMAALSIALALVVSVTSRYIVLLVYGKRYLNAAGILSVHIWTGVFVFVGCVGGQQLIQEKLTKIQLQRSAIGAVLNVGLNCLLIPRFGGVGSAVATLAAQGVAAYLADGFDPRTRQMFRMKTRAYLGLWLFNRRTLSLTHGGA